MSRTGERQTSRARPCPAVAHRRGQSKKHNRTRPRHHLAECLESRLMLAAGPVVESLNRASPAGPISSSPTVRYVVVFSEPVTGVDPSDFSVATTGSVTATTPVQVAGGLDVYAVTVNNVSGSGTLTLNLIDDGTIKDTAGNPLQPGGQPSFSSQTTFAAGSGPRRVAVADLNGDGKPDVVVTNYKINSISVLLGNGDGTLQAQATYAVTPGPYSIVIADLNGDGKQDLLVAGAGGGSVLLGNGNGTFGSARDITAQWFAAVADVNHDGKPDLLTAGTWLLLGDGAGGFGGPVPVPGAPGPATIADVNGDGNPDVISEAYGHGIQVALGNGDGTFRAPYTISPYAATLNVADFNGDGKPDVIAGTGFFAGNGDGSFKAPVTFAGVAGGSVAADINGDAKPDVVSASSASAFAVLGNGDGTFKPVRTFATGPGTQAVAVADFNGDGHPDLVTANNNGNTVGVLLGAANGNFTGQTFTVVPYLNTINGTAGNDTITLTSDPDHVHVDWTLGTTSAQMSVTDPAGLTINSQGGRDGITFNYVNGNPLPARLNLNGMFTLGSMSGTNPLAGVTLNLTQSTVYLPAASANSFLGYLSNGYDGGKWDGVATATTGVVVSSAAAGDPAHATGIGWANAADGYVKTQPPSTFEMAFARYGDTDLNGTVDHLDLNRFSQYLGQSTGATWDEGDFNYDGAVDATDEALLSANYFQPPYVLSIDRNSPAVTTASGVAFTVTFNDNVTGVDPSDFRAVTAGAIGGSAQFTVTPVSGSVYTVTVAGLHGSGSVQLELGDDDSIRDAANVPLGGGGANNGSFTGPVYTLQQVFPTVLSIVRASAQPVSTDAFYTVTFSEPVTGVDPADFQVTAGGGVTWSAVNVTPQNVSTYTVDISGLVGNGTVRLDLVDNGSVRALDGNPLVETLGFQPQKTLASIPLISGIVVADLNADGTPDLVGIDQDLGAHAVLSVCKGNGDGTFQPAATYQMNLGSFESHIQVADVNGDGVPDVIISYLPFEDTIVAVMLGNGDATFRPPQTVFFTYPQGPQGGTPLTVGDLNNDGRPDLVLSNGGRAFVAINAGNGSFYPVRTFAGASPQLIVADVNGDGNADLVGPGLFLPGNGDGTFRARQTFGPTTGGVLSLADLNSDGNLDEIVVNSTSVSVLMGNGDGTFHSPVTYATTQGFHVGAVGDVNGDGFADIDFVYSTTGTFGILPGRGDGTFGAPLTFAGAPLSQPALVIADVNGDGRPDLLTTSNSAGLISVLPASAPRFTGQTSIVGDLPATTSVTLHGSDTQLVLVQDPDGSHIDWTTASSAGRTLISDPAGFTVNRSAALGSILVDYSNGNPLPKTLHLNGGTYSPITLSGLTGADPLAGTTLDITSSVLYIDYSNSPGLLPKILQYLKAGYNGGAWTGTATPTTGVITSTFAAASSKLFTLGYADSADGAIANQPAQTLEVRFTVPGDADLDGTVNSTDALILARNYLTSNRSAWDQGNFNYDSTIDSADAALLQKNYGTGIPPPLVSPADSSQLGASDSTASAGSGSSNASVFSGTNAGKGAASGANSLTATPDDPTDHSGRKRGKKDKHPH